VRRPVVLLLALALLGAGVAVAGCGGSEEVAPTAAEVEGTLPADTSGPADTGGAETTAGETTGGETTGGETTGETQEGGGEGDPEAGKEVFASAGCGGCHTLADANSSGNVGPNLDEAKPDVELVVDRVTNGQGAMPAFKDQLSPEQINDVAAYVSQAAGS
jgi:mono/diheme cytochrome c family protein